MSAERPWRRRFSAAAAGVLLLAMCGAAQAQSVVLSGTATTYVDSGLDAINQPFTLQGGMWATPSSADILIMSDDGGTTTPLDYTAHLNSGRHVLMVGGSNWGTYYTWVRNYLNIDSSTGWHQSSGCTTDWIRTNNTHPIVRQIPATYEFSNQSTSYHMLHFTPTQPANTLVLGRSCEASDRYTIAVRTYPSGGTFTYVAYDLGQYTGANIQAQFIVPLLRGYFDFIRNGLNQAPTVTNPGTQTHAENQVVSLQVQASDPNGDNLSYSATGLPPGLSINSATGLISGRPTYAAAANSPYSVTVTVNDGAANTQVSFSWVITNTNRPPTLTNPGNQSDAEGDTVNLLVVGADPDGDNLNYSATGLPAGLSINSVTGRITGTLPFDANDNSPYSVTVRVSDGSESVSVAFSWAVANTNRAPMVTSPGNQSDAEGDIVSLGINANDPDGDNLSYTAAGLPMGLSIDSQSGVISGTVSYEAAANSPYTVSVTVTDGDLSANTSFSWAVANTNRAPAFVNLGDQSSAEGAMVDVTLEAMDPDGDPVMYSAMGLPPGLMINSMTGQISGTLPFDASDNSPYAVRLIATDGDLSVTGDFMWLVGDTNRAPVVTNPGNQASAENQMVNLTIGASDPDGDRLTFLAQGLPPGLSLDPISGQISGTLPYTAAGTYAVTVSVSDGNLVSRVVFSWTVDNVNRAPSLTSPGSQSGAEGDAVTLQLVATDADMDTLSWSAMGLPPGLSLDSGNGRITGMLGFDASEDSPYTVNVTVTDGEDSDAVSFTWTVDNTNRAPVVINPGDQNSAENQVISLQVLGNDPDGDTLAWSAMGLPPGLMISPTSGQISGTLSFTASQNSPYNVTVGTTDGDQSAQVSFTWRVNNTNRPPVVEPIADRTDTEADDIELQVMATDPDGDSVTFSAAGLPPGLSIHASTGRITGTLAFNAGEFSPYDVTVFATDGGGVGSQSFVWSVEEQNRPPVADAGGPYTVNEGAMVTLRGTGSDPDGNSLTYTWDLDNDGQCDDAMGEQVSFMGVDGPRSITVTLCLSDGGATVRDTSTVDVRNLNPTVAATADPMDPQESQEVSFEATGSDPAGANDPLTFTWNFGDNTGPATGAQVNHTFANEGTYTVTVTANDGDGGSATTSLSITVGDQGPTLTEVMGPTQIDEGSQGSWRFTIGKAAQDVVLWNISWGDGSANNSGRYAAQSTSAPISRDHTYADNGTYTINVTAEDDDGTTATRSFQVEVSNVAPTITSLTGDTEGMEGQSLSYAGVATDPGADTLTWTWSWGDGSQPTTGAQAMHTFADAGTYTVTATVSDEDGGSASRQLTVVVGNAAPVISALGGDTTGAEGQTLAFTAAASDAGGDALTYTWDFGDSTPTVTGVDRTNVTHVYRENGAYTLTLTVTDGTAQVQRSLTVNVSNANPMIQSAAVPESGQEGQRLSFAVNATDPAGTNDPLTYTWDFGDGSDPVMGASAMHTFADDGAYFVEITVRDDDGGSVTRVFSVSVSNVAPQIVDLSGDFTGDEGDTFSYTGSVTDPGDDTLTWTWSFGDGSDPIVGVDEDTVSHVYLASGAFTLTLTVVDEDGGRVQATRTVNVGGQAPTVVSLDGDTEGDEGGTFSFEAVATDPGNDAITYTWDFGDGSPAQAAVDLDQVDHVFGEDGEYTVTLTVSDDDGSSSSTVTVTVSNVAPSIDTVEAPTEGAEGQLLVFEATGSDPGDDNDPLTWRWDFGDGSDPVARASANHRFTNEGTYTVTLTVSDDDGGSASRTLMVEIRNAQPSIVRLLGPNGVAEAQSVTFQALATDPGDDALTYTWSFGDGSPSVSGVDLTEVNHAFPDNGTYTVTLRVSDGVDESSRTLTVPVSNRPPVIASLTGDTEGLENDSYSFQASASDPAGMADPLTWSWNFGDGSPAVSGSNLTMVDHVFADAGNYTVTLTVSDDDNGRASQVLVVRVGNAAPVISALSGDTQGVEGGTFAFTGAASDAGNDALTWTWDYGDGSPVESGRDLNEVSHVYRDNGDYTLTLTVSDGTANVSRTLDVSVTNVAPTLTEVVIPSMGQEGVMVSLSATATDPARLNDPLTYRWSFGDGSDPVMGPATNHTWADDGVYTVTLTVRDDDGGVTERQVEVTINNVAPRLLVLDGPEMTREGSEVTFTAVAQDVDADTVSYRWEFEGGPVITDSDEASHTWTDDGTYTVTLTLTDEDGGETVTQREVVVGNVNPSIVSLTGDFSGAESEQLQYQAEATDPGADTLTWEWNFGDGTEPARGQDLSMVSHAYELAGVYTLRLTVSDDDGGQATITRTVNINTAGPSIQELAGPSQANEGDTVSFSVTASDPTGQTLTWSWDFGDGTPLVEGEGLAQVEHTYADNGSFFLSVTVTDPDGLEASSGQRIEVANVNPVITEFAAGPFVENQEGSASALATDPGADELTFTWSWGDGTQDADVDLTEVAHTYRANGTYLLTLTVRDGDGGVATRSQEVIIEDQAPVIVGVTGDLEGDEGDSFRFEVEAADPAGDELTYTWQIDDNDPVSTGRNSTFLTELDEDGEYSLTVVATDSEGQSASTTVTVVVNNVAPSISPVAGLRMGVEGQSLGFFATASDPAGDNDPLTWTWDFGDGSPAAMGQGLQDVTHAWADNGTYTMTVTVTDDEGAQAVQEVEITVTNASPSIASLFGPLSGAEGEAFNYTVVATDPGADTLTYTWSFGDGSDEVSGTDAASVEHSYADNGSYTLTLVVSDEDGGSVTREIQVEVRNVPPSITSEPPLLALLNRTYRYPVMATDPGADTLTYTKLEGPENLTFTDSVMEWTPTLEELEGGPYLVRIEVCDDDGGCATQSWEIRTDFIDEDGDGVPDDCEQAYGLDPADPSDGDADNDQDGINNRDECLAGTDPTVFNGPTAPAISSPEVGGRVAELMPALVVVNATDPDLDELVYTFEVYTEASLSQESLLVSMEQVVEGEGSTSWALAMELSENTRYWWRARASDPYVAGPWSQVGDFLVDQENEAPSVPVLVSPVGSTDSLQPALVVDASSDPEGDAITYLFEVYSDAELTTLVTSGEGQELSWMVDMELSEDATYWWRAAARDEVGAVSEWAQPWSFLVNMNNRLPEAPKVVRPDEGELVDTVPVAIEWEQANDEDGDALTYELEVADNQDFTNPLYAESQIPMGEDASVTIEVPDLTEDSNYWLRVRAFDPFGAGPYTVVGFLVNAEPTAPTAPVLISPINDERVAGPGVTLVFEEATDLDGDALTYEVRVFSDAGLSQEVTKVSDVANPNDDSQVQVEVTLEEAGAYWWTVRATDATGLEGPDAEPESFTVTIEVNEPPTAPVLVSPIDGVVVDVASPFEMVFDNATDPEGDALTYTIEIYTTEDLSGEAVWSQSDVAQGAEGQTRVTVEGLTLSGDVVNLWWRVTATDAEGNTGASSSPGYFVRSLVVSGSLQGNSCACSTPAAPAQVPGWPLALALGLGALVVLRRRR